MVNTDLTNTERAMNPNTENVPQAPTVAASLPSNRHAEWVARGWLHLIAPMHPETLKLLVSLGAVDSGYRKPNEAPHGSSCSDGESDRGFYVPQAWVVGEDHEAAQRWVEAGRYQGIEIIGWILLVAPSPGGGAVVFADYKGHDICDWPCLDAYTLAPVAGPPAPKA